jgi:hypothetical protein
MRVVARLSVVALAGFIGAVAGTVSARRDPAALRDTVVQPSSWVPFVADLRVTYPDGPSIVGRFYQAGDGSSRLETGPPGEAPRVIHIKSVVAQSGFIFHHGQWFSNHFKVGSLKPPTWYRDQLRPCRWKLSLRHGGSGSVVATDGFSAYEWDYGQASFQLLIPELNMFAAVRQRVDGRREVYSNIEIVDPDPALFAPPPGAPVSDRPAATHAREQRPAPG